jgi:integrator complex subunit 2
MSSNIPIHPVLPSLLEVYTQSVLVPGTGGTIGGKAVPELTNEPLTDDEVLGVYKDFQKKNLAPQLLVLYYVLLYEDTRLNNCRNLLSLGKKVKVYSAKLFSQIPIKYLLQEAQSSQEQSGGKFTSLITNKNIGMYFSRLKMAYIPQVYFHHSSSC